MSDNNQSNHNSGGVSKQAAQDYLTTPQGQLFLNKLRAAGPKATAQTIEMRAMLYLRFQPELPKYEIRVINPFKLKAAAEYLEWGLKQYPNEAVVQELYQSLLPMIDAAKSEKVFEPVTRQDIPGGYLFGDGVYDQFNNPDVGEAYVQFKIEMMGGRTEQDKRILANMAIYQQTLLARKEKNCG